MKVAENVAKELSVMEDDGTCTVSDVRMVLQAWLHLASFNLYDTGRVGALVEEINMMHQQVLWPLTHFPPQFTPFSCGKMQIRLRLWLIGVQSFGAR